MNDCCCYRGRPSRSLYLCVSLIASPITPSFDTFLIIRPLPQADLLDDEEMVFRRSVLARHPVIDLYTDMEDMHFYIFSKVPPPFPPIHVFLPSPNACPCAFPYMSMPSHHPASHPDSCPPARLPSFLLACLPSFLLACLPSFLLACVAVSVETFLLSRVSPCPSPALLAASGLLTFWPRKSPSPPSRASSFRI